MLIPAAGAWAEEPDQSFRSRHNRGNITALIAVAGKASQRQIAGLGWPAVFFADDMIDLTPEKRGIVLQETVFAEVFRPRDNAPPHFGRDIRRAQRLFGRKVLHSTRFRQAHDVFQSEVIL